MQLTAILLLVFCLQLSAGVNSQTVSFTGNNVPLKASFDAITSQTGYAVVASKDLLRNARPVTITAENLPLTEFLNEILKNQALEYSIIEKSIVIKKKSASPQVVDVITQQPPVTGRITDAQGKPLQGINIVVKGTAKGTSTDADGNFIIDAADGATLVVSGIGYLSREWKIAANSPALISLKIAESKLDEVQVIAYGQTTQRFSTGNVVTIKGEEINRQPIANPIIGLQARVPGLYIQQATGFGNSAITVRIQGQNSMNYGNEPFYVVDGVPYLQTLPDNISGALGISAGGSGSPLSFLNPAEIESISVLKDADATAIYGSRAANGAILITTKKGQAGQTRVSVNLQHGWGKVTRKMDLMNREDYLLMRHEALKNDGLIVSSTDYDLNGHWDTTRTTDWQEELLGGTAQYSRINAAISGGSTLTRYYLGTTYARETTVFPGKFEDKKAAVDFSLSSHSQNQKFTAEFKAQYMIDNNRLPNTDFTTAALTLPPVAPAPFSEDGSLNWQLTDAGVSTWANPYTPLVRQLTNTTRNLLGSVNLAYNLLPGLDIRSSFGYTYLSVDEKSLTPLAARQPELAFLGRSATFGRNTVGSWTIEPQLNYSRFIGAGKLEALAGMSIQQSKTDVQRLFATGYANDRVLEDMSAATDISISALSKSEYKYNALFARLNYNLQDKYLVNLTARRDGSSRFGSANRFNNFASAGIGWIFSEEGSIKEALPWLSFGKLRASYGTTGNDQIGDYRFIDQYFNTYAGVPYQNTVGLSAFGLANPYLQWEETKKLQAGLDLGFKHDRILLSINYFRNQSSNQLLTYQLPWITGFSGTLANFPAVVRNTGLEFSLFTTNINRKETSWTSSFNLTVPKNKLAAFPGLENSTYAQTYVVGQPVGLQRVYRFAGVNDSTGVYEFFDHTGKTTGALDYMLDRTSNIQTAPKWFGGFTNTFRYKGVQVEATIQFVKQMGSNYVFGASLPGLIGSNQPRELLNRWQKPGDQTGIQKFTTNFAHFGAIGNANFSDATYVDASFARLKTVSVSWQLPAAWIKSISLHSCSLYVQGQNLFTITGYKGLDPETQSAASLPPLRVLTTGLQLQF